MASNTNSTAQEGGSQMAAYKKMKRKQEMKYQLVTFTMMIFFTIIAFLVVGFEAFSATFAVPFILLLAGVQVIFQLYYFMHMNHKGHEAPTLFIFSGLFMGVVTVAALMLIVWW